MVSGYPDWSRSLVVWNGTKWVRFGGEDAGVHALNKGYDGADWQNLQVDAAKNLKVVVESIPTPGTDQTVVQKTGTWATATPETVHTVTAGKTFYLFDLWIWWYPVADEALWAYWAELYADASLKAQLPMKLSDFTGDLAGAYATTGHVIEAHPKVPWKFAAAEAVKVDLSPAVSKTAYYNIIGIEE